MTAFTETDILSLGAFGIHIRFRAILRCRFLLRRSFGCAVLLCCFGISLANAGAGLSEVLIMLRGELSDLEWRAAAGDAESQFQLGVLYAEGVVVPRSFVESAQWFHQAAAQGVVAAQYNLGLLYEAGVGVQKNPAEAVRWFRLVAEKSAADPPDTVYSDAAQDIAEELKWYKAIARAHVFAPPKPIVADSDALLYGEPDFSDPVPFDDSAVRAANRRVLRLRRMQNDMRYATDGCFGDHRDLWYADVTRPTPLAAPPETDSAGEVPSRSRPDRRAPSDDTDSSASSSEPSTPSAPSEPSVPLDPPPEPPPEPPPLPPEPPPGGG